MSEISAASKQEMASGRGTKDDFDKPPVQLLPTEALEAIARVMGFGARKYSANNWRRGMAWTRVCGGLLRHVFAWLRGEDKDRESGEPHLAHAGCMLLFLLTYTLTQTGEDDRWRGRNE